MTSKLDIWKRSCIPKILFKSIVNKIKRYLQKYDEINTHYRKRRDSALIENKHKTFLQQAENLFDIAVCKFYVDKICNCDEKLCDEVKYFLNDQL